VSATHYCIFRAGAGKKHKYEEKVGLGSVAANTRRVAIERKTEKE
jgi:hypothetical protein